MEGLDHYSFWSVAGGETDRTVMLQDPFDGKSFDVRLTAAEILGNPAKKIRENEREVNEVRYPEWHLLGYSLGEMEVRERPESVIVRNQCTEGETWFLGRPRLLLIPAFKAREKDPDPERPPQPGKIDHFLCYDVSAAATHAYVKLIDQFGEAKSMQITPKLLGFPVKKNDEDRLHPDLHLAIYEWDNQMSASGIHVRTADQLGRLDLDVRQSIWLGVPSMVEQPR